MKKNLGILGILLVVFTATAFGSDSFLTSYNLFNLVERSSLYGIIGIGVAFVIMTSGIDLSIGSLIGLVAIVFPFVVVDHQMSLGTGLLAIFGLSLTVGIIHGLLITKLKLQPFVVTLCGLMIYRGLARWLVADKTMGYGDESFASLKVLVGDASQLPGCASLPGAKNVPVAFLILIALGIVAAIFLNKTIWGRYLLALGRNEQAARFSGISTSKMIILAYVICSLISGLGGLLFALDYGSIQPDSFGSFYELYAIAAAVLGGCSLRGGEGSIFGIVLGAALMRTLMNSISMLGIDDQLELTVIGFVILIGVIVDELVKRIAAHRRAVLQARQSAS
ncbi:MAG: ABC transporter permease [Fuerstiella sp.]|jgi:ribose transport system permease protein|nr:ABC transporter permease [Fuerstiella sp.]MCP4510611.1 ABC transporter permease [Fuerstiella sp.]MDG2129275.1 ABC transporter permease [Fuerstiella sp.]